VNVIFELGMVEFDSFYLFMPLEAAQTYFRMYTDRLREGMAPPSVMASDEEIDAAYERVPQASAVDVFVNDPDDVVGMRERIQAGLSRPLVLTDWQQRNETFFSALQVERAVMFTILSSIILVAAFNIVSSLVMLVKDKGADIAILRTMGATRRAIMRVFMITGTSIGVVGTLAGLTLGLVLALNVETIRQVIARLTNSNLFPAELYFLSRLPAEIDPTEVATVVGMSLALSILAPLYPAWRAARLDPVQALRYG
jgi:lipoprotein-releasing system permease protein